MLEAYVSSRFSFLVTYALLFLLVYLAIIGVGWGLRKVMSVSLLGWFDRLMGGLFGLGKAVLLASVLFMVLTGVVAANAPVLRQSTTAPYLTAISRQLLVFVRDKKLQSQFLPKNPAISFEASATVPAGKAVRAQPQQKTQQRKQVPPSRP